ncbi:phosphopantetheine-binding protein [Dactylosporangium sp. NPDC051485]|uniref:acyl carrier protein n=1 Tax=Dactylosporangium sp. NPDC051485 TaxID=3154846 RepID=UPI0034243F55
MPADQAAILAEVAEMLYAIRDHHGVDGEITMSTTFQDDLEMESIDVVSLAGRLQVRFGDTVNFAQFIAGLDLDEARHLRVGQLVEHIAASLDRAGAGPDRVGTPA